MSQQNPSLIISTVAEMIRVQLDGYAKPRGGFAVVLENERHLWEWIYNDGMIDERPRIAIINQGETARGEYAGGDRTNLHRVDRQWLVVIMRGHGFKNLTSTGQGQENTPGYIEPFSDSCETIRDGIRVMEGISEEFPVDYKGFKPLPNLAPGQVANIFMDARAIEFATAADIPAVIPGQTL